jgi:uncharacterized membrane protein YheB (UPF0754 family)
MEFFHQISETLSPFLKNIWVQISLLILFATVHGYAGAWLAVRMLFRPRKAVKFLGITVFPQGMIPRHRERLANAIGKAVGEELVSTDTVVEQLTGNDFLRRKVQAVVDSYTNEILSHDYPSFIDVLPKNVREPVLDSISMLQRKIALHIESVLSSEESLESIRSFVERRVDDVLSKRVSDVVDEDTFLEIVGFFEGRVRSAVGSKNFENNIRDFISRRVDDLFHTETPLGQIFTDDAVALLKDKANDQIEPVVHRLTELAAAERTRSQIGALIKREVHEYYEALPFFKKIFVSRENLLRDVDVLVNESLPKRIEETLRGDIFAEEARLFISSGIDNAMSRPLPELIGTIAPEQLDGLKAQISRSVLSVIRSEETLTGISAYITDTLAKLRRHSIDAIMQTLHPESEAKLKSMLSKGLLNILSRRETLNVINSVLASQLDRLLAAPIGKLSDHISEEKFRDASHALTEAIVSATSEKLPEAVREFNVGGVVREKILHYPGEKLESLVLSVAQEHLRTIELFGALFGFLIGVAQAIQFYIFAR